VYVLGSGFMKNSRIRWNGVERADTKYEHSGCLSLELTDADVAAESTFEITVFTPAPGGGLSNAMSFPVIPEPRYPKGMHEALRSKVPVISPLVSVTQTIRSNPLSRNAGIGIHL